MKIYNIYRKEAQIEDREYPSVSLGGNRRFHTRKQTFPCEETSVSMRGNECVLRKKPMCPTAVHKSLMLILTLLFLGGGWNVLLGQDITTPVAITEITASSSSGTNVVSNINDNINDTYWSSQGNDDKQPYIILDLGSVQEVDVVNIRLATGSDSDQRPTSVTIQYSIDNEEGIGNTAVSNQNLNRGDNEIDLNNTISARYIRLSFTKRNNNNQIRVYEISLEHKISYNDITILHKAGQWYNQSYQSEYLRTEVTDLYGNDTFDETNSMITTEFGDRMQNTHEYRVDIYMNPGQTRTLTLPGIMLEVHGTVHLAMYNYLRWYNYETDGIMNNLEPTIQGRSFMFENGLIGGVFIPEIAALNIDKDFDKGLASVNFTMPTDAADNAVYYVACDQSNYTDVSLPTNSEEMYEPTLSQRAIFVIHNASSIKDQLASCTDNKYFENYTIHFPTKRISNKTHEQVALSMPAQNYFCNGENENAASALSYEIDYPETQTNQDFLGPGDGYNNSGASTGTKTSITGDDRIVPFTYDKTINDGDIAYINVYKSVNNTRYNIAQFTLIFDSDTEGLTKSVVDGLSSTDDQYFRTNAAMEAQNYELLTKMNLDYENVELKHNANYFPYPMNWTYSSYGFYTTENIKYTANPQWGEYAITKSLVWDTDDGTQPLNPDGYHLFVDANERPGTICTLPFRESLCPGAMMYVTMWISSRSSGSNQCDASVIFVLKGINADGTEDVIYRKASGQIPYTAGEWYQLYFSYPSGENDYEQYVLQIENNCANTRGADFCIDDIRVYMNPLDVEGHTTAPICSGDAAARIELQLDYDLLLRRLGMERTNGAGTQETGYYSFLNKAIYDNTYNGTNYEEAFSAAVLHGSGVYIGSNSEYYGSITFSNNPSENDGQNGMASLENGSLSFISEVAMNASADGDRPLQSGEEYYIVFNASTFDPNTITTLTALADVYAFDTRCTVKGEFLVEGPLIVRVNGEVSYDASTPCIGQVPHVEVLMKDQNGDPVEGAVFDWYFGTLDEFNQEGIAGGKSLEEMLEAFRHFYPTITNIGDNVTPQSGEGYTLSQEEIDYIKTLNEEVPEGGQNPKLTLSASSDLLIRLRSEETHVVLIPIGEQTDDSIVCWEPSEITLYAQDGAPTLFVGYEGIQYPAYATGTGVSVRMDLEQMNTIKAGSTPLSVPVREPRLNGNPTTIVPVDNDRIAYLAFTDDPLLRDEVGTGFDYEIGSINNFQISSGQNYVHFNFNNYFTAREGYRYYVTFRFRTTEQTGTSEEGAEACYGNAVVPILIVPKYEVWIGGADGNWNSDANWRRADKDELHKDATDSYLTNTDNGTNNGFVPIFSTKIIIPQEEANNQIQLYTPVRKGGTNDRIWNLTQGKDGMTVGDATNNIEYDLVMRTTDYTSGTTPVYQVRPYYTNVCEQIHFAPTATMFHQERLNYQQAWVEFEMDESKPYWMSSPLKDVYAGDMYATKGTGRQETELFKDITYDETNYDRWNPAFYQKAWDRDITYSNDATGESTTNVAAVASNWNIEYNDVTVPYSEGKGFYSRVENISGDKALVRLPKADPDYTYYENVTTRATNVGDRTNAYKLALDQNTTMNQISISLVDNNEAVDGDGTHFLVGNPFMTYLNMNVFFTNNSDVLESKYWTLSDGTTKAVVGTPDVEWTGNETENGTDDSTIKGFIKPMTAFFVEKKATAAKNDIVFTTSMMADKATATAASNTTTRSYSATNPTLTITAERGETRSVAKLLTSDKADNGYRASEDAVVLLDSELDAAMVYTVSGSRAAQVNAMKEISNVGLGVYNENDDEATVTISGLSRMASPLYLYDARTRQSVELSGDSYTMQITGDSHGRYYLRNSAMADELENTISIYSARPGEVIVSALQPVKDIRVFALNGSQVRRFSVNTTSYTFTLPAGIYLIQATDGERGQTEKVLVR